jgi:hypothetical protein
MQYNSGFLFHQDGVSFQKEQAGFTMPGGSFTQDCSY